MICVNLISKKSCSKCGVLRTLENFCRSNRYNDGRMSVCRKCLNDNNVAWRSRNPERLKLIKRREYNKNKLRYRARQIISQYNITLEDRDRLLSEQGGCAVCGTKEPRAKNGWHIDHDHNCCSEERSCGKCIRGILCTFCNSAIGMFKDSKEILNKAIKYLENYEAYSFLRRVK